MKRLSSWLFGTATGNTVQIRSLVEQTGSRFFFTEALITCGDKTACDTQLSRSRRLRRRRRLAKKNEAVTYIWERWQNATTKRWEAAPRGGEIQTHLQRDLLFGGAADWEPLAPTEYSSPLPARWAARTTAAKTKQKRRRRVFFKADAD